jgi:hypothetical protein
MLAIRIHETGGVETLRVDTVAVPAPGAGEVRLRKEPSRVAQRAARLPAPIGVPLEDELHRCAVLPVAETHERPAA